ncbi:hypothetical protein HN51_069402 [Arachis hypogaea]
MYQFGTHKVENTRLQGRMGLGHRLTIPTVGHHHFSALLALPSSSLRDAITQSRTAITAVAAAITISSGLQLRALELSIDVSIDHLPSSKPSSTSSTANDDGPPVSNSLIAAIKRSQENQRCHPDTFHLMQIYNHQNLQFNQGMPSFLKVELKYFVLSIFSLLTLRLLLKFSQERVTRPYLPLQS